MRSQITSRFRKLLEKLPPAIRKEAAEAFRLFRENPYHPSLVFKQVHETKPIFSARVTQDYRVVGIRDPKDKIVWFWVGDHGEYDALLKRL